MLGFILVSSLLINEIKSDLKSPAYAGAHVKVCVTENGHKNCTEIDRRNEAPSKSGENPITDRLFKRIGDGGNFEISYKKTFPNPEGGKPLSEALNWESSSIRK